MQKNKIYHILSYIPLLFIISLVIPEKNNPTVRFHCGQGMLVTLFSAVCSVISGILNFTIGWIPVIGSILTLAFSTVAGLAVLALMVIGILHAAADQTEPLPILGAYAFYR